ncbi:MAG: hypothetical protein H7A38_06790 [Chlamydiales bacterium]|nr:hypothetical protein [Chlamydiales bacterium]
MALKREFSSIQPPKQLPSKIFDAKALFQQEEEEAKVLTIFEKLKGQEIHVPDELLSMMATVNLINVKTLSPTTREKFQSLCGRLHTINTNMMVDAIVDEAQKLKMDGAADPRDIEFLRKAIAEIWENNSLSEVNSNLLRVASITLAQLTSGKNPDMVNIPSNHQLEEEMVLPESTVKGTDTTANWEEAELAFDLLDVAGLLYQGKIEEGLERAASLPKDLKLPKISEESSAEELAIFIQEAVVKSFEIGRKDGYIPSSREIQELLEEAANLS